MKVLNDYVDDESYSVFVNTRPKCAEFSIPLEIRLRPKKYGILGQNLNFFEFPPQNTLILSNLQMYANFDLPSDFGIWISEPHNL